jgi:methanogenic corrinoid protein MtbC1
MDAASLESVLEEAVLSLGQVAVLSHVIGPLVQRVGDGWQAGTLKVGHEHLASAVIRTFLANAARPFAVHASAPMLVATTPSGQVHEIGAALVAAAAANKGWRITYLGPSLPAEEIASAALQSHARAVALSLVHPADDPQLPEELRRLQRLLPEFTTLIVGGAAVDSYEKTLQMIGAKVCRSLNEFGAILDGLRQGSN